jgi:endonuclease YncB( thermonuclease family)
MTLQYRFLTFAIIILLVSIACSGADSSPPVDTPTPLPPATATQTPAETPPGSGPSQPNGLETVTVARVVDGDTIELTNGRRVRYIGINTPERDQPYYPEATALNRQLVEGKNVQMEFDLETFDQYGRSLAYIWSEGVLVNLEIVRLGSCACPSGFVGTGVGERSCTDTDECYEGTHDCDSSVEAYCINTDGGFDCDCGSGYTGDGHGPGSCVDLDECAINADDCSDFPDACINVVGGWYCECPSGYGVVCYVVEGCYDIDECYEGTHDCDSSVEASCINTDGGFD